MVKYQLKDMVIDADDQYHLPDLNSIEEEIGNGTTTDSDGNFGFGVNERTIFEISHMGMLLKKNSNDDCVILYNSNQQIDIQPSL